MPQLSLPPVSGLYLVRIDETEVRGDDPELASYRRIEERERARPARPKAQVRSCCTLQRRPLPEGAMLALCNVKSLTVRGCE